MTEIAMGIDLGTSNSCVAIWQDGRPVVVPNEWGEMTHASVVSFMEDGTVLVGNSAKQRAAQDPERTVASAKRLIGRFSFAEEVKKAQALCSYAIVAGENNSVRIGIDDNSYSVPEISAMVLKEIKRIVEDYTKATVTKAVITVPAFFNDSQRQETKNAGRIAGLEVLRILNEPTAAALAYGFGQNFNQRVVIYDLGGGTFDVSILQIGEDIFEVMSTAGDTYLGGNDFDECISKWVIDELDPKLFPNIATDSTARQKIRDAAEAAKISLVDVDSVVIHIPDIGPQPVELELTRKAFNKMCMHLVQRTFKVCDEALQSARLTVNDIDGVILVGGPTRLPIIRNGVRHYFQREPNVEVNPDQVVALGAAIQAEALLDASTSTFLLDVTPQSLRLGTVKDYSEVIIEKNTAIPIERTRTFATATDGQERVKIKIYQGESRLASECEELGEFEFSGLRHAARGEVKIEVTFEIDTDGIVQVNARDVETGQVASTTITLSGGMDEAAILEAQARNAQTDLAARE